MKVISLVVSSHTRFFDLSIFKTPAFQYFKYSELRCYWVFWGQLRFDYYCTVNIEILTFFPDTREGRQRPLNEILNNRISIFFESFNDIGSNAIVLEAGRRVLQVLPS
ncbi:hypothetical protein SM73_05004 [Klebsiella quasipneumoniae]|nr:hypothetical protein SM73_05004 [Klebsiella quasipneumoniae]